MFYFILFFLFQADNQTWQFHMYLAVSLEWFRPSTLVCYGHFFFSILDCFVQKYLDLYFNALGLVVETNHEFEQTSWGWRTGCRHRGDVSACNAAEKPHFVMVLPVLSGNARSRAKRDVFQVMQRATLYLPGFLSFFTESLLGSTAWTLCWVFAELRELPV